jgi:hypothetical protein
MRPVHLRDPDGTPVISLRLTQEPTLTSRNRTSTLEGPGVQADAHGWVDLNSAQAKDGS